MTNFAGSEPVPDYPRFRPLHLKNTLMLPATGSAAFLTGQAIGFLVVFFLVVIFPMLTILRMARHDGISGSDRVLWVVVIYCVPLLGPVTYFLWEITRGRKWRRTISEPAKRATASPAGTKEDSIASRSEPGFGPGQTVVIPARPGCRCAAYRCARVKRRNKQQGRSRLRKRPCGRMTPISGE